MDELEQTISEHIAANDLAHAATAALDHLGPQILGYLGALLRDDDAAREVFDHFSEELWKSIGTMRGKLKPWIYTLVMRSVGQFRRAGRKPAMPLGSDGSATPDTRDRITRLRDALDPDEQVLLFLRVDQKLSWHDIAAVIGAAGEPVEVATLRERFEHVKRRLCELAAEAK